MLKRLSIVFLLGFSSGLPFALVGSTLQAWFADAGLSVTATTMLSLLGLPYLYRVLWGPILDRITPTPLGKRRSWIVLSQLLLILGFNLLAFFSPEQSPKLMALIAFLLACFSATQDIVIDAHRIEYLPPVQYGLGASLAVSGYRVALFFSGGVALIIAAHWGFALTYRLMGLLMLLGMIVTLWSPEPSKPNHQVMSLQESFKLPLLELLKRPKIGWLLGFILCYVLGEAFTTTTSSVVMPFLIQGLHFSLETIAYINKILGIAAIFTGGLLAGVILLRLSLFKALFIFGFFQMASNALFVVLAVVGKNTPLLATAVFFNNVATGMATTALVAFFMKIVNKNFTATQFSLLVAFSTIPRIFAGPIAGFLEQEIGWVGLYQCATILAFLFIPFLWQIKSLVETHEEHVQIDAVLAQKS